MSQSPGITYRPLPSTARASAGTTVVAAGPTALITPSVMMTFSSSMTLAAATSTTFTCVNATDR
jgi:hypothetical protein